MTDNRTIHMGSGNYNERIEGDYIQGIYYAGQQQSLAEAAADIQDLLEQLSKTYPADTTTGKMKLATEVIDRIESNPTFMERILSALKAGGISALEQALNHPTASFVIDALEDWQQTKVSKEL
jgi:aspartokinase